MEFPHHDVKSTTVFLFGAPWPKDYKALLLLKRTYGITTTRLKNLMRDFKFLVSFRDGGAFGIPCRT